MIEILNGTRETVSFQPKLGVRLYDNKEIEDYPLHWHTAGEIIMPLENIYTVNVNNTNYVLQPHDICVIPSGELHQLCAPESGSRIILQYDCSLLYHLEGFDSALHTLHPCTIIKATDQPEIHSELKELLIQLKEEYFKDDRLIGPMIYSILIRFFVILGRDIINHEFHITEGTRTKQHEYIDKFMKVCSYINEHCTEQIEVDDLASIAGFSKYHFARLFKQFTNISYYDYLNQRRIMEAQNLLCDPSLTITEVAMRSGFNSLATFNRIFKAQKNCTPREYKQLHSCNFSTIST